MKKSILLSGIMLAVFLTSCVSKKKYTTLQTKYQESQSQLYKANSKLDEINEKVSNYYAKIRSLKEDKSSLIEENAHKLEMTGEGVVVSENAKAAMRETLQNVDPERLAQAETLSDSIDLAVSYNLQQSLGGGEENDGINVNVENTVVEITISNDLLFSSGSYWVNPDSYDLLKKIAKLAKSEPSVEVLVEGHTDSRTLVKDSYIKDNWELSVRRATSVVRILQNKFDVDGEQLIAAGRSSYKPIAENSTEAGRQKNRRIRIIVLPNLDKFLALLEQQS